MCIMAKSAIYTGIAVIVISIVLPFFTLWLFIYSILLFILGILLIILNSKEDEIEEIKSKEGKKFKRMVLF